MLVERRVAGILLAAGAGSRLGQPKATVEIGGEPLAGRGVALLRDAWVPRWPPGWRRSPLTAALR